MSTSAITANLFSAIANSPATADQFISDLNRVVADLQSGNLAAAQQDWVTLTSDLVSGTTSSSADTSASGITALLLSNIESSLSSATSFLTELNQLGTDLGNSDVTSSQEDVMTLESTALSAASSTSNASGAAADSSSSAVPANQAEITTLVKAIMQAMVAGDNTAVSSAMAPLASVSPSSPGGSILQQESENFGANSSTPSASNGLSQIVESMLQDSMMTSTSGLSEIA